jgi:hypothetical protein
MGWFTVKESRLVWAPVGTRVLKNGEEKTRFLRIGVRVDMMDGSWWFFSFKHGSWTKHWPRKSDTDMFGRPNGELLPEKKDRYTSWQLYKEWGGRKPELVSALEGAVAAAAEEESVS